MQKPMFFLTIEYDRVMVKYRGPRQGDHSRVIESIDDLREFVRSKAEEFKVPIGELVVMASSTLDFPRDWTKNRKTIALCRQLRY